MKKILLIILILISLGCERNLNTPTESTEEYISNYQNLSDDVVKDIEKSKRFYMRKATAITTAKRSPTPLCPV